MSNNISKNIISELFACKGEMKAPMEFSDSYFYSLKSTVSRIKKELSLEVLNVSECSISELRMLHKQVKNHKTQTYLNRYIEREVFDIQFALSALNLMEKFTTEDEYLNGLLPLESFLEVSSKKEYIESLNALFCILKALNLNTIESVAKCLNGYLNKEFETALNALEVSVIDPTSTSSPDYLKLLSSLCLVTLRLIKKPDEELQYFIDEINFAPSSKLDLLNILVLNALSEPQIS